jgi:hypothetical protein
VRFGFIVYRFGCFKPFYLSVKKSTFRCGVFDAPPLRGSRMFLDAGLVEAQCHLLDLPGGSQDSIGDGKGGRFAELVFLQRRAVRFNLCCIDIGERRFLIC